MNNSVKLTRIVASAATYADKQFAGFTKTIRDLVWNNFAWFASEPGSIIMMKENPEYLWNLKSN